MEKQATLSVADNRLVVNATGGDSAIFLPPFAAGKRFLVQIILDSPADTAAQLFYLVSGQAAYTEARSQIVALTKGRNVVYFQVAEPNVVDPIRFDPGALPGTYTIESMVARALPSEQ